MATLPPRRQVALHTRLRPGAESEYELVHAVIPTPLAQALHEAGVHSWRIWRDGRDLFHLVECDDYDRMLSQLSTHPANLEWQARMAELIEPYAPNDSRSDGPPLRQVWELP